MMRTVLFWMGLVLWSLLNGVLVLVATILTLGLARRWLVFVVARIWGPPALWMAGARTRVLGREHLAGRAGRVVVINHSSTLDLFAGAVVAPPGSAPVGKIELWRTPVLGQVFWMLGFVWVDRGKHDAAMQTVHRLAKKVREERLSAWFAPEGTRSATGALQPFHMGAFVLAREAGVPVVPIVLHGAWDRLPARGWTVHPGPLVIQVHPPRPIPEGADLREWADALHDDYARWLTEGPPAG